ncbi:MAG: hypothetical protein JWM39_76 [Parcubacteria group bacterium]|nr:hypothetical protein [Parcubacteria group bacterium]
MVTTTEAHTGQNQGDTGPLKLAFWVISIVLFLTGFTSLTTTPLAGILYILAAGALMPPTVPFLEKKIGRTVSQTQRFAVVIVLLIVAVIAWVATAPPEKGAYVSTAPKEDMNLGVHISTLGLAMGDSQEGDSPVITIKNLNSFEWNDCDLKLNDTYTTHLDFIDTPTGLKGTSTTTDTTMDSMVVPEGQFTKSDGTRFASGTQVPRSLEVVCSRPEGGSWVGSFGS